MASSHSFPRYIGEQEVSHSLAVLPRWSWHASEWCLSHPRYHATIACPASGDEDTKGEQSLFAFLTCSWQASQGCRLYSAGEVLKPLDIAEAKAELAAEQPDTIAMASQALQADAASPPAASSVPEIVSRVGRLCSAVLQPEQQERKCCLQTLGTQGANVCS